LGPFGEAVVGIIATLAKMEAERISARVKAGLARAKADGKQLGRRRIIIDRAKIAAMREQGSTLQEIARRTGASPMTVHRILHRAV
jgi:DNA invertase Pin-like site-specific DNA recombinase